MEHQKTLNLLNEQTILNLWQENGALSMINHMKKMVKET